MSHDRILGCIWYPLDSGMDEFMENLATELELLIQDHQGERLFFFPVYHEERNIRGLVVANYPLVSSYEIETYFEEQIQSPLDLDLSEDKIITIHFVDEEEKKRIQFDVPMAWLEDTVQDWHDMSLSDFLTWYTANEIHHIYQEAKEQDIIIREQTIPLEE